MRILRVMQQEKTHTNTWVARQAEPLFLGFRRAGGNSPGGRTDLKAALELTSTLSTARLAPVCAISTVRPIQPIAVPSPGTNGLRPTVLVK